MYSTERELGLLNKEILTKGTRSVKTVGGFISEKEDQGRAEKVP